MWFKTAWQNKDFRVLCFSIFNAIVAYVGTALIAPQFAAYSPILVPFFNMFTKYINNRYFGDLWVSKE